LGFLREEHLQIFGIPFNSDGWSFRPPELVPQQVNKDDCGAFTMAFARDILLFGAVKFSSKEIISLRHVFAYEILTFKDVYFPKKDLLPLIDSKDVIVLDTTKNTTDSIILSSDDDVLPSPSPSGPKKYIPTWRSLRLKKKAKAQKQTSLQINRSPFGNPPGSGSFIKKVRK
jgi:hypothetical protein